MLTQLNQIDGVASSSARLADDGSRLVQITVRPGAKATQVAEKVRSILRAEVQSDTPKQLEGKSAEVVKEKQDWLTLGQLNTIAALEETSARRFDMLYWWLLAVAVFVALGAVLFWLRRRQKSVRQRSAVAPAQG